MRASTRRLALLAVLAGVLGAVGCAVPTADTTPVQPLRLDPPTPYHTAYIAVESRTPEDVTEEVMSLETEVAERIRELNLFPQVMQTGEPALGSGELLIHVTVSDVKRVGGVARFFLGIFAGAAYVDSRVQFVDGNTLEPVGSYEIIGKTPANQGTTRQAVLLAAKAVADLVEENYAHGS